MISPMVQDLFIQGFTKSAAMCKLQFSNKTPRILLGLDSTKNR